MLDQDSIGAIKVPRMIWTSTILSLGSLLICVLFLLFSGLTVQKITPPSCRLPWNTPTLSSLELDLCIHYLSYFWKLCSLNGGWIVLH